VIGPRVRLAREACGFTQIQLAELTGITQGTLSDIESGQISVPSENIVAQIANATGFPEGYFCLGPLPDFPDGSWRKLKRGSSKVTAQIRAQSRHIVETMQRLEPFVRLPPVLIHALLNGIDPGDAERIERVAQDTRHVLGIGSDDAVPNVCRAIERVGVLVAALPTPMPDHSGFSVWPDQGLEGRPLIVVSSADPGDKMRFTLAHELGHLILHTLRGSTDPKTAESEANRFAGALLLPRRAALRDIRIPVTLGTLAAVKQIYGTSIAMNAKRSLDLSIIDQNHFISLRKQISARGWTRAEPVEVPRENPILIGRMLQAMGGEGSINRRAANVNMNRFQFRALVA
jgi:Zn-dependent peptidase ImmA (M78 family)/transcriptional regulator with XRE-family HTH domain